MGYRRAEEILPAGIIKEIQKYADGVNIYIPRKEENRREWGEKTSYRYELQSRNRSIYKGYLSGQTIKELAGSYYLSEKSIQRILRQEKKNNAG